MNKNRYRIVFNKARGLLMVVAEKITAHGKGDGATTESGHPPVAQASSPASTQASLELPMQARTPALRVGRASWHLGFTGQPMEILVALSLLATLPAQAAGIVADTSAPANQKPTVLNAGNGVPLVNIQTPSAAGVSRNTYSQFDVSQQGAILNNSRNNVQTQLGGYVQGNPWLAGGEARVILNEVNSNNPSLLQGYIEVAGNRAQVVIANPAGVTCDGCGFINANRATLTTGSPIVNGGNLDGYLVQRGTVTVQGGGMDASQTDYTDIIARAVQVNAGIWANNLKVTAGSNRVDAANTQATIVAGSGTAPAFAVDVATLGGMYAGKITLIGTEAGVGVRNAGSIGASAGDIILTVDGRLENANSITASGNATIAASGTVSNSGTLYAQGNTTLATQGDINNSGLIAAQGNADIQANGATSRIDSTAAATMAAGLKTDGTLGTSGNLTVAATQSIAANGYNFAAGDQTLTAQTLDLTGSQTVGRNLTFTANNGNLNATNAVIAAGATLAASATQTLTSDGAKVSADQLNLAAHDLSNIAGELIQTGTGNTAINLAGNLDNSQGRIATNSNNLTLSAATLTNTSGQLQHAGSGTFNITATTLNGTGGNIQSNGALNLQATTATLDSGTTTAQQLTLNTASLSNRSGSIVQTGTGATVITATTQLDNTGGTIASNGNTTLTVGNFVNQAGTVQAAGTSSLTVNASGAIDNSSHGNINASGDATLNADSLDNTSGQLTAINQLTVGVHGSAVNHGGTMASNHNLTVAAGTLDNTNGMLASSLANNAVTVSGTLINTSGQVIAGQDIQLNAGQMIGDGKIMGGHDVSLQLQSNYTQSAANTITADHDLNLTIAGDLTNMGRLQAVHNLNVAANNVINQGTLGAGSILDITTTTLTNTGSIVGDGVNITATQDVDNAGSNALIGAISSASLRINRLLSNRDGATIYSQGDLDISADGVRDGSGALAHQTGTINNLSSLIEAAGTLEIAAHTLNNIRNNVQVSSQTVLNETVAMLAPTWRVILAGGTNYYSTVSSNYVPQEIYYVNPADIIENGTFITPDGHMIGRAVINTHANDSAFFVAQSGAFGGYGHRERIIGTNGTRVIYYYGRTDGQSNPDQVAGTTGGLWYLESNPIFFGWDTPQPAFSSSYGSCSSNCVRLVTEPDYTDPVNRFARITERVLGPHIGLYENRRDAHHTISDDTLSPNAGQEAQIISGGNMRISFDQSLNNQYARIASGANLSLAGTPSAQVINQGLTLYRRHTFDGQFHTIDGTVSSYTEPSISEAIGTVGGVMSGAQQVSITGHTFDNINTSTGTAPNIQASAHVLGHQALDLLPQNNTPHLPSLQGALYRANPDPQGHYLYESDPRLTDYRSWLSSDYMLTQLSLDPSLTQKRLGDGFYEQRLIREQVAQLTGRRYLDGYADDESEYRALLNRGITYARQYGLIPGMALSASQMAAITSDMVWLETQSITLADGSTQQVLAPKLYLAKTVALQANGALVSANEIVIDADDIRNRGGQIAGNQRAVLVANADILNLGGTISASDVRLSAGRDIVNQSLTVTEQFQDNINRARYVSLAGC